VQDVQAASDESLTRILSRFSTEFSTTMLKTFFATLLGIASAGLLSCQSLPLSQPQALLFAAAGALLPKRKAAQSI
jgi:hypothetical protein